MNSFKRTLTLRNSVFLGMSSMVGAGLFVNIAPAAVVSSYSLVFGLLIASIVAFSNASSSAQLAKLFPEAGGTYLYARKILGNKYSLVAGIVFIFGKIISSVAIALTFGNYLFPSSHKIAGAALVVGVLIVSYFGAKKTALVAKWFVYSVSGIAQDVNSKNCQINMMSANADYSSSFFRYQTGYVANTSGGQTNHDCNGTSVQICGDLA